MPEANYAELTAAALVRLSRARSLTDASTTANDPDRTLGRARLHVEIASVYAQLAHNALLAEPSKDDGFDGPRGGPLPPF
ncbi:hypothetical protein ACWGN5_40240 [Streptomyces sp. NPDC055815]